MASIEVRDAVLDAERRGELLTAVDLAERALAEDPGDLWLKHRAVLALARAGSTDEAARRFAEYGLAGIDDEDIAALEARIAKDVALAAGDETARRRGAARSADLYEAIFRRTGGYYPAVNAATLSLLAGAGERAHALARDALAAVQAAGDDSYYGWATVAEAEAVLGRADRAAEALAQAAARHGGDFAALATTRRQLRLVCAGRGLDLQLLDVLAGPAVVHFCGHRIAPAGESGRFPAGAEDAVAAQIDSEVATRGARYAYGALASGADILWAESFLAHGAELHVVLPFARDEFVRTSVADSGPGWVERFERCMAAATEVTFATDDAFLGDDVLFRYGSELAMGLTLLRARYLEADVTQLAVWNGLPAAGAAGTAIDVATWMQTGNAVVVVDPRGPVAPADPAPAAPAEPAAAGRVVRAMLFADVKGFSRLTDEEVLRFLEHAFGAFAEVLARYDGAVVQRNTWGDALYVVLTDASTAAACAHDLQDAMGALDLEGLDLPTDLALRLSGHVGPVFTIRDPVLDAPGFTGSHVSRTARIEPVTPPGEVYVTEAFAAALVLAGAGYQGDYVGHMPAAKDYGRLRMYRLRLSPGGTSAARAA